MIEGENLQPKTDMIGSTFCSQREELKKQRKRQRKVFVKQNWGMYVMLLPGLLSIFVFTYLPYAGLYLAFTNGYTPSVSLFKTPFYGFLQFEIIFADPLFLKMIRNTLIISTMKLVVNFPLTIILAFAVNALHEGIFKKGFQIISYLPGFISWIIVSGMVTTFLDTDNGLLNRMIISFGGEAISWYTTPKAWYWILLITNEWKCLGNGTIIYIVALLGVDPQLYEAAEIDGASRMKQIFSITIPSIMPIISMQLILCMGNLVKDDFEQIYSLVGGNDILDETMAVLSTKIYQLTKSGNYAQYPKLTAMGLFQSAISLIMVILANFAAKRLGQKGIW